MLPGVERIGLHASGVVAAISLRSAGMALAVGVAAMAVSLLVMSRTQWGQAQPISKCIALALFAHLLLFIYAYDTELELGQGGGGQGGVVSVSYLEDSGESPELSGSPTPAATESQGEIAEVPAEQPIVVPAPITTETPNIQAPPLEPAPPPERAPVATLPEPPAATTETVASETVPESSAPVALPEPAALPPTPVAAPNLPVGGAAAANSALIPVAIIAAEHDHPRPSTELPNAVPEAYQNRIADDHLAIAERTGGNLQTEQAVARALGWFDRHQSRDGRWDADQFGAGRETRTLGHDRLGAGAQADTGLTGLALLAYLAGGQTHRQGDHQGQVENGLKFLIAQQAADGNLAGAAEMYARMYCHGMATLALSEAYAMTDDSRLRPPLERAIRYTLKCQHPQSGGWRYLPGDPGDMSQFGWQVMALKSAELGGLPIPDTTLAGMKKFLETASSGSYRGLVSYRSGERPSRVMTAEGLACRWLLGTAQDPRTVNEATNFILQETPSSERENLYYWYYGTLAMFHLQDERWQTWNRALQGALLARQRYEGDETGSWDPDAIWGTYGGRIYSTALATLCLEVYYRYLPLTQVRK